MANSWYDDAMFTAGYKLRFDLTEISQLSGFPLDQELLEECEQEVRSVVDGLGAMTAGKDPLTGRVFLELYGQVQILRNAADFLVRSHWLEAPTVIPALNQLAQAVLAKRSDPLTRPAGKDVAWAREWTGQSKRADEGYTELQTPQRSAPASQPIRLLKVGEDGLPLGEIAIPRRQL